jgi:DNA-binding Xre family transcriptional regulator
MLEQTKIAELLLDRNLLAVSKRTSISYASIHRLVNDPERRVRLSTLQILSDYLTQQADDILRCANG